MCVCTTGVFIFMDFMNYVYEFNFIFFFFFDNVELFHERGFS